LRQATSYCTENFPSWLRIASPEMARGRR
jgi:hypothetical protein